MTTLSEEEQRYLNNKFEDFKLDFWRRFKIPAIGLAVVFAGLVSVFATYLYMQAKINVMEAQEELTKTKIAFYEGMNKANTEIKSMIENYNSLVEQAGISVGKMKAYEKEIEDLVKRHAKLKDMKPEGHPEVKVKKEPFSIPTKSPPDYKKQKTEDVFKIDPRIQQQMPIVK